MESDVSKKAHRLIELTAQLIETMYNYLSLFLGGLRQKLAS